MANILLITEYYEPKKSIATNRMLAFAKYLTEYGHNIIVLTEGKENAYKIINNIDVYYLRNNSIKQFNTNKKENSISHYSKCLLNKIFSALEGIKEEKIYRKNILQASKILEKNSIDIVISSYPTLFSMIIANALKNKYDIKWIADMRDPWWSANNIFEIFNNVINKEVLLLNRADIILTVSKPLVNAFSRILKNKNKIFEIRNGYDFDSVSSECYFKNNIFTIVYAGSFYGKIKPYNFFKALEAFLLKYIDKKINVKIIGNYAPLIVPKKLKNMIQEYPRMDYLDLIHFLKKEADLQLLILPTDSNEGVYSGKIFDYIGTRKPILALVPPNDVAYNLVKSTNIGYLADNDNISSIEEAIYNAYNDWENRIRRKPNENIILEHHRRNIIKN